MQSKNKAKCTLQVGGWQAQEALWWSSQDLKLLLGSVDISVSDLENRVMRH
jgi:hypothetical protein